MGLLALIKWPAICSTSRKNRLCNANACAVQRYIVRIIFMVPLYALMSFFSLVFEAQSVYFGSIRDW